MDYTIEVRHVYLFGLSTDPYIARVYDVRYYVFGGWVCTYLRVVIKKLKYFQTLNFLFITNNNNYLSSWVHTYHYKGAFKQYHCFDHSSFFSGKLFLLSIALTFQRVKRVRKTAACSVLYIHTYLHKTANIAYRYFVP